MTLITDDRLIDRDDNAFIRVKKVLVLGMPRTGTNSMLVALQQLGFAPYHMREAIVNHPRDLPLWVEAAEAKFAGKGKPYGRQELDKLTGKYDALTDAPPAWFADDLIQAYPDAKVILTIRDPDKWLASMNKTILRVVKSRTAALHAYLDPDMFGNLVRLNRLISSKYQQDFGGPKTRQAFLDHYDYVRSVVPKKKLLEFGPKYEWEPLCEFLGVPVPDTPYPCVNDAGEFNKGFRIAFYMVLLRSLKNLVVSLAMVAPIGGVLAALWLCASPVYAVACSAFIMFAFSLRRFFQDQSVPTTTPRSSAPAQATHSTLNGYKDQKTQDRKKDQKFPQDRNPQAPPFAPQNSAQGWSNFQSVIQGNDKRLQEEMAKEQAKRATDMTKPEIREKFVETDVNGVGPRKTVKTHSTVHG